MLAWLRLHVFAVPRRPEAELIIQVWGVGFSSRGLLDGRPMVSGAIAARIR